DYCKDIVRELNGLSVFGEPGRALLDARAQKATNKRWAWVKKGAPLIVEVGPRDLAAGNVSVLRRDRLYAEGGKLASVIQPRADFIAQAAASLQDIQGSLFAEAKTRHDANIARDVTDFAALKAFFD